MAEAGDERLHDESASDALASAAVRERLLEIAQEVVRDLRGDAHAAKQAATASAVCLREGLEGLEAALGADYDGGGMSEHWRRFRAAFRPRLAEIRVVAANRELEEDAVLFTLGWVRRLGAVAQAVGPKPGRRAGSHLDRSRGRR